MSKQLGDLRHLVAGCRGYDNARGRMGTLARRCDPQKDGQECPSYDERMSVDSLPVSAPTGHARRRRDARRCGLTLIELVVSSISTMVLLAGLTSAIFIASRAVSPQGGAAAVTPTCL